MGNVGGKIEGKAAAAIGRINWSARYKAALRQILTNIVFILLCVIATIFILLSNIFRTSSFRVPIATRIRNSLHLSRLKVPPQVKDTAKELFL
jgi:hypothetical protein